MFNSNKRHTQLKRKKTDKLSGAILFKFLTKSFKNHSSVSAIVQKNFISKSSVAQYANEKKQSAQEVLQLFVKEAEIKLVEIILAENLSRAEKLQSVKITLCQLLLKNRKHYIPLSFSSDDIFFDIIQKHLLAIKNSVTAMLKLFGKDIDNKIKDRLTLQLVGLLNTAQFLNIQQIEDYLDDFIHQISNS